MKFLKLIGIVFILSGFAPYQTTGKISDELTGTWVYANYDDELLHYEKKNKFEKDKPGIEFKADGNIIKRQNASFCGTPPITYRNYNGRWTKNSDSTLLITYEYWGGMCKEEWLISSLQKEKMVVKRTFYQSFEKNTVERDRFQQ